MCLELLILCGALFYLFRRWATTKSDYFEKSNVPYEPMSFFSAEMLEGMLLRRKSPLDQAIEQYRKHNEPIYGIFILGSPVYVVQDLDLIRKITIKDFDHFVNHSHVFSDDVDGDIFGNTLFSMRDERWREMRNTLSPAFTGHKLRKMLQLIEPIAENFNAHLRKEAAKSAADGFELNVKEIITHFTNDVIASTAFGLHVNSFEHMNNEFYRMGKRITTFDWRKGIRFALFMFLRPVMKWLRWEVFEKDAMQYFTRLVLNTIQHRLEHNNCAERADMINLLMEARSTSTSASAKTTHNREWCDKEILAQCLAFFFAGFETTSTVICCALHELMENPAAQQQLYREVLQVSEELHGAPLTFEVVQNMQYMDMVVSETLRKWPPSNFILDRECSKDISYDVAGVRLGLKRGDLVWIPIAGMQRDAKYFENPDCFEPERFSAENKQKMPQFTYMPFGSGPRLCIASRFVLMTTKILLFNILLTYRLEPSKNSTIPLVLSPKSVVLEPITGFWLKFVPRNQ